MNTIKISVILALLLAIILFIGILSYNTLSNTAEKLEKHIVKIEVNAQNGDWKSAENQLSIAKTDWVKTEELWSILIDHIEIDNIDDALKKMEKYILTKNITLTLAEAATLRQYITHIPEKEAFKLKNIL